MCRKRVVGVPVLSGGGLGEGEEEKMVTKVARKLWRTLKSNSGFPYAVALVLLIFCAQNIRSADGKKEEEEREI